MLHWQDLRYFRPHEFACRCGCSRGPGEMDMDFLLRLDRARLEAGFPFVVTSGFRCEEHNRAVGGVVNSSHLEGLAADIELPEDGALRHRMMAAMLRNFLRVGLGIDFVHVDVDVTKPFPAFWRYA